MNALERVRQAIERRKGYISVTHFAEELLSFLDTLSEEPDKNLEESAIDFADNARKQLFTKDYAISSIADYDHGCIDGFKDGAEWGADHLRDSTKMVDKGLEEAAEEYATTHLHNNEFPTADSAFIAGAEWQKEQDQPITGNSLEQEWLRYVDRKKKECRGELPSLGEYGWLQIARHFAKWQEEQMMKKAVEGEIQMRYSGSLCAKTIRVINEDKFKLGDKVKLIVIKED